MAQGNRGFAQGLTNAASPGARLPPRTSILGTRDNRLAELAAGHSVTRIHELVDPAICRIWDGHNRAYDALDPENCADLIESFKAQGRQEVPAIVRRITGDSTHLYEVICGARRHWTVSWMRAHDYPEFRFLIEPRELTDEEAFRIADLENRSRRDLSDLERARDYARAVERYYEGSQQRMAERLEVTKSWLSRYLELARLPEEIVSAFPSWLDIGISHGAVLAPLLRNERQRTQMLAEARAITEEQRARSAKNLPLIGAAAVVQRLTAASKDQKIASRRISEHVVRGPDGDVLARGQRTVRGRGITISLPAPAKYDRAVVLEAVEEILEWTRRGDSTSRSSSARKSNEVAA